MNKPSSLLEIPNPTWKEKPGIYLQKEPISLLCMNEVLQEVRSHRCLMGFVKVADMAVQSFVSKDVSPAICWQSQQ
jgi:hypothetical protein